MLGERLGKWVIYKELGRGGMGRVYLAQEEIGGRKAAIKVLAAELAQDAGFLHRFQREIESLSQLSHPNIVRFYESGHENGLHYYAMEYVEGQSLEEVLHAQGRLPWPEVLDLALQVCPALKHVHDHGIIHRDLKPPNLLRTADGQVKLMDFGIAKVFASNHLTATGGVVGTAEYLSPEQAAGKPVTKRSDLYSLGVVLYTLLTGRTPFEGTTFLDLLHKHRYAQFDPPRKVVPDLPYELDEVVCALLAKDPAERPPDCLVLGRQLESIKRKLDRKSSMTQAVGHASRTVAENSGASVEGAGPGPATLMSRLMREELQREARGGPVSRLLNNVWVVLALLVIIGGILVWTFWPASAESLYARGSELMKSPYRADWERAKRDYFDPLNENFPDHPYREEVAAFLARVADSAEEEAPPGEAQRQFRRGERLLQEGRPEEARRVWEGVAEVFAAVPAQKGWARRARQAISELTDPKRADADLAPVREALKQAEALAGAGKRDEAERIWRGVEELYATDPRATALVREARAGLEKRK